MTVLDDRSANSDTGSDQTGENKTPAVALRLEMLQPGFSPRLQGENPDHIRVLAEAQDAMPPILVHRPSMRIIDGMHRFRAAREREAGSILVEFFDGSDDEAFLLALKRNATHGYPLTMGDREAAVRRILQMYPDWSDRAIAESTGISSKTVGAIRRRSPDVGGRSLSRIGRDGRVRPLDAVDGRLRASRLLEEDPSAPIRQIAREAGISLSTAQDVRRRVRTGESPLPSRSRQEGDAVVPQPRPGSSSRSSLSLDPAELVEKLKMDPSLRLNEVGRHILRLLEGNSRLAADQWLQLAESIPDHWSGAVSNLADEYANFWRKLAQRLRDRQVT